MSDELTMAITGINTPRLPALLDAYKQKLQHGEIKFRRQIISYTMRQRDDIQQRAGLRLQLPLSVHITLTNPHIAI